MIFRKGRENLSTTVYVPFDCLNNCKFCTSKKEYTKYTMNALAIKQRLHEIANSTIQEVVFTGGEPMANVDVLKELISIVKNKDVYINTSLLNNEQFVKFVLLVNETGCIKGVNVSRHYDTYEKDCMVLSKIAEDSYLKLINKPIKINVVMNENVNKDFIKKVLNRWNSLNMDNLRVCFRADFTKHNTGTIHDLSDPIITMMSEVGEYINRSYCNVCDTTDFMYNSKLDFSYHRGVEKTAIKIGNIMEINDIIILPNGQMVYDWDGKNEDIIKMQSQFRLYSKTISEVPKPLKAVSIDHSGIRLENNTFIGSSCGSLRSICGRDYSDSTRRSSMSSCGSVRRGC